MAKKSETIIKIENLSFAYGAERPIVTDFTADVLKGERIGVVGENGTRTRASARRPR